MNEYIEEYLQGETIENLCKKYKKSRNTIIKELKSLGISIRNRSEAARIKLDENVFETIDTEEKAYWLGFIAADGCVSLKTLSIALKQSDKNHLQKFLNFLKFKGKISVYSVKNKEKTFPTCSVTIQNKKILDDLNTLGIFPRKSLSYIPVFDKIDKSLHVHFWRGMIDGDGHLVFNKEKNTKSIGLTCNNFVAVEFQKFLLNHLNFKVNIYKKDNINTINIGASKALKVMNYLYLNSIVFLDRKYQKFLDIVEMEKNYQEIILPNKLFVNGKNRCKPLIILNKNTNEILNFDCYYTFAQYLKLPKTNTRRLIAKRTFTYNEIEYEIL